MLGLFFIIRGFRVDKRFSRVRGLGSHLPWGTLSGRDALSQLNPENLTGLKRPQAKNSTASPAEKEINKKSVPQRQNIWAFTVGLSLCTTEGLLNYIPHISFY